MIVADARGKPTNYPLSNPLAGPPDPAPHPPKTPQENTFFMIDILNLALPYFG